MSSHLLIFGASGISGLAVTRKALQYPTLRTFSRITGLTNRPLTPSDVQIPADPCVAFYSGFDLTQGTDFIVSKLQTIPPISQYTHVAFLVYVPPSSNTQTDVVRASLLRANVAILSTAVAAIEAVAPNLTHITIQTGGKAYGVEYLHTGNIPWSPPLKEDTPRAPEPYAGQIFYYAQIDAIAALSTGKSWSWTDIRSDAAIGWVPNGNAMDLAGAVGIWLSMYRLAEGEGAEMVFPGNEVVWSAKHTDTSQEMLERSHLYVLVSRRAGGRSVNVGDGTSVYGEGLWAGICGWFELKGVGPWEDVVTGEARVMAQKGRWEDFERNSGIKAGTVERAQRGCGS